MTGFHRPRLATLAWPLRPLLAAQVPRVIRRARAVRRPLSAPHWAGPRLLKYFRHERKRVAAQALEPDYRGETSLDLHRAHLAWLRHQEVLASGVVRRDPYLDPTLIATMSRVPRSMLLHGDMRRGLFRAALADLLPPRLRARTDKALFAPALARFLAAAGGLAQFEAEANVKRLGEADIVEPRSFRAAFDAAKRAPDAEWASLWSALSAERFLRSRS
jgi:hypothetical protein